MCKVAARRASHFMGEGGVGRSLRESEAQKGSHFVILNNVSAAIRT